MIKDNQWHRDYEVMTESANYFKDKSKYFFKKFLIVIVFVLIIILIYYTFTVSIK
jgi:hypothetical protein